MSLQQPLLDGAQQQGQWDSRPASSKNNGLVVTVDNLPEAQAPSQHVDPPNRATVPAPSAESASTFTLTTLAVSKAILGAGMMVIPKACQLLGMVLGLAAIALVAFLTWFTIDVLIYAAEKTGKPTFAAVVRHTFGRTAKWVLLASVILNCYGLQTVYVVITGDILVGTPPQWNGVLRELLPWLPHGAWYMSREAVLAAYTALVLTPLTCFVPIERLGAVNAIGVGSIGLFAASCVAVAAAAGVQGGAHAVGMLPDWSALGDTRLSIAVAMLGVMPVLMNADICHQAIFPTMPLLRPYTRARMSRAVAAALAVCNTLYAVIAFGCVVAFGPALESDALANMSATSMAPLLGAAPATVLATVLRLGYMVSLAGSYAMAMFPLRHCIMELVLGRRYHVLQPAQERVLALPITLGVVLCTYVVAVALPSVWLLFGLVGSVAATTMGFIFPGALALAHMRGPGAGSAVTRAGAVAVIALGGALLAIGFLQFIV